MFYCYSGDQRGARGGPKPKSICFTVILATPRGLEVKSICFIVIMVYSSTVIVATRGRPRGEKYLFYCHYANHGGTKRRKVFVLLSLCRPRRALEAKSICFTVIIATRGEDGRGAHRRKVFVLLSLWRSRGRLEAT